jgi:hypothetical protein
VLPASKEHPRTRTVSTKGHRREKEKKKTRDLPIIGEDDLLGGVDETGFGIGWRVEDLARILIGGGHDDETACRIGSADTLRRISIKGNGHVKYANRAQVTGIPLTHVTLHGRLNRVREFTNNWDGPFGPGQVALLVAVDGLFEREEGEEHGKSRVQP